MRFSCATLLTRVPYGQTAPHRLPRHLERVFVVRALDDGMSFKELLKRRPHIKYPPMAVIAGTGNLTRNYLIKDGPRAVCGLDEDSPTPTFNGDDLIQVSGW